MNIILTSVEDALADAWDQFCGDLLFVPVYRGSLFDLSCDAVVSPANSYIMGTRVTLRTLLASLREGASVPEITRDFPTVTEENVRAVIAFAAASAEEDLPVRGFPDLSLHQVA